MHYPYRGHHAISRSVRLAEHASRIAEKEALARAIRCAPPAIHRAHAIPLRAIDLLEAFGEFLQQLAKAARLRVARSPPQSGVPWP